MAVTKVHRRDVKEARVRPSRNRPLDQRRGRCRVHWYERVGPPRPSPPCSSSCPGRRNRSRRRRYPRKEARELVARRARCAVAGANLKKCLGRFRSSRVKSRPLAPEARGRYQSAPTAGCPLPRRSVVAAGGSTPSPADSSSVKLSLLPWVEARVRRRFLQLVAASSLEAVAGSRACRRASRGRCSTSRIPRRLPSSARTKLDRRVRVE